MSLHPEAAATNASNIADTGRDSIFDFKACGDAPNTFGTSTMRLLNYVDMVAALLATVETIAPAVEGAGAVNSSDRGYRTAEGTI